MVQPVGPAALPPQSSQDTPQAYNKHLKALADMIHTIHSDPEQINNAHFQSAFADTVTHLSTTTAALKKASNPSLRENAQLTHNVLTGELNTDLGPMSLKHAAKEYATRPHFLNHMLDIFSAHTSATKQLEQELRLHSEELS